MASTLAASLDVGSGLRPFIFLRSTSARSCLPIVRYLIDTGGHRTLLFSLAYPSLHPKDETTVRIFDWTANIPGYCDSYFDPCAAILEAVRSEAPGVLTIILDSVDTLASDVGSPSMAYNFLSELLAVVRARPSTRLVLHATEPSDLCSSLCSTRFSSALVSLVAHPIELITHIATAYLAPPPPLSSPEKYWRVFLPLAERSDEIDQLVFDRGGPGTLHGPEFVVEGIVRGANAAAGGKAGAGSRGVDRFLAGWSTTQDRPEDLSALPSLRALFEKSVNLQPEAAPDPTQNVSFNLNLTPEQQQSRSRVPLPYAYDGKSETVTSKPATIYYDPDSADDMDDDDPDEDLDI